MGKEKNSYLKREGYQPKERERERESARERKKGAEDNGGDGNDLLSVCPLKQYME